MMLNRIVLLLLVAYACAQPIPETLEGFQNWIVTPTTDAQVQTIQYIYETNLNDLKVIFWEQHVKKGLTSEMLVSPDRVEETYKELTDAGMIVEILTTNIQQSIDEDHEQLKRRQARSVDGHSYDPKAYNTYEDIITKLKDLTSACSSKVQCSTETVGYSVEGKDLVLFKMTTGDSNKKIIWLDSLIHAREWLAGSTVMRMLEKLVDDYGIDPVVTNMVDSYDWYVLPVMNPDGYSYSWTTGNRFWRKNRSNNAGYNCKGVDLNRNYDHLWSLAGTSGYPCSDIYRGPSAASEPETKAIQYMADKLAHKITAWLSFHTTAKLYLMPYGYGPGGNCTALVPDHQETFEVLGHVIKAIEDTHNTVWGYGNVCDVLYSASGGTMDYVKNSGVKYVYTPELRGPGFNPGTSAIEPSFEENWNGLVDLVKRM